MSYFEKYINSQYSKESFDVRLENMYSVEARNILKDSQIRINNRPEFVANSTFTENVALFSTCITQEDSLNLFKNIFSRRGGILVSKLKSFYFPKKLLIKLPAKNIMGNQNAKYQRLMKIKKNYGISNVIVDPNNLTNNSVMYDLSGELGIMKLNTLDRGITMQVKIRHTILEYIKSKIVEFPPATNDKFHNKVVIFEGPFFVGTKIRLTLTDVLLKDVFKPHLFFLEWLADDLEGFKKFIVDNNVTFMFKGPTGKTIFLSNNPKVLNHKNFNLTFIMKTLHILDGAVDKELIDLNESEKEVFENDINTSEDSVDQLMKDTDPNEEKENYEEIHFDDIDNDINDEYLDDADKGTDTIDNKKTKKEKLKIENDVLTIEEQTADSMPIEFIKRKEKEVGSLLDVLEEEGVTETEQADKILENHNYTQLKDSLETSEVKKLRQNLNKKYGKSLAEVVDNIKKHKIKTTTFNKVHPSPYAKSSFINFEETYNDVVGKEDFENVLTSAQLSSASPLFLSDVKVTPVNDREFYGKTLSLKYNSTNGEEHDITLDMPEVIDGRLFIGGSFKRINKQDAAKPVIKTDNDVIITTAYNKTFLSLKGYYASRQYKQLVYAIDEFNKSVNPNFIDKTTKELGDFVYKNMVHYNLIHLNRYYIQYIRENAMIDFRGTVHREYKGKEYTYLGYIDTKHIYHDPERDFFIVSEGNKDDIELANTEAFILYIMVYEGKKYTDDATLKKVINTMSKTVTTSNVNAVYSKIMDRYIPVVYILLTAMPINELLEKMKDENNLEYKIVKNNPKAVASIKRKSGYGVLEMANDVALIIKYNNTLNELIWSPLMDIDMSSESIFDINKVINEAMGNKNTIIYIENFVDFFTNDPMTRRVMEMYNLPSDFVGLFIYASSLFTTHKTSYKSDASNYRLLTTSEVIHRCLYNVLTKEFSNNASRVKMGSKPKINIPRDELVKKIQELPNVAEHSKISPFRSIMGDRKKSFKGQGGLNKSMGFSTTTRMMSQNNIGAETAATPYSGEAGVTKTLPVNPSIDSITGEYRKLEAAEGYEDPSKVTSFIDSMVPYLNYDHIIRKMMANNQFDHCMPVYGADPMLVSYGADESALYMCSDFAAIAEEPGQIVSVNDAFVKVKYKSGKIDVFPMDVDERNADKGYFVPNKMKLATGLKEGSKFSKGDPIVYNKFFFKDKKNKRVGLSPGPLTMILICDGEGTWEDACVPFDNLAEKLTTPIVKRVARKFSLNTEVRDFNTNIGATVDSDDVLYKFRILDDDTAISSYFEMTDDLSMEDVTAHNHGKIKDIRIYYRKARDVEMSESIKKFVREVGQKQRQINFNDDLKDVTDEFKKTLYNREPQLLTRGSFSKINGDRIDNGEILVEYMIESEYQLGSGDKIVVDRALKGEPSDVLDSKLRPVGELSGRKPSLLFNTYGLLARITPGMVLHGTLNTILMHIAIKNRMILNKRPEPGDILDFKSSMDMVEGKYKYKD
ncbi:MAG: hypothetical protein ACRC92_27195 [Peptostreptococcaceae bacterium]